ncbi:MAG: 30S ribosomal protein S6 [Candidatus Omnitrophica bacterium]|nr:30S ribosomal protein S6 [Candidatus Omnitrophota bacterium]
MSKYEMVFILDARLSDGEKTEISKQVTDLVAKVGGKVLNCAVWFERQKMAFALKKAWEGAYYLMNAELPGAEIARFRKELLINERVLRFLIVKQEELKVVA